MADNSEDVDLKKASFGDRILMNTAVVAAKILVAALILIGIIIGSQIASNSFGRIDEGLAKVIGGVVGFMIGALVAGTVALLSEIERNTRHTAKMFERLARRQH